MSCNDSTKAPAVAETTDLEKLHLLIEHNADGVLVIDREGLVRMANPAAGRLLNRSCEELNGQPFGFPVVEEEAVEIEIIPANATARVAEMRVVPLEWDGREAYLASLRDITERKEAERRHRELIDQLAAKNEELEQFAYTVSHDLRSPLVTVGGFLSILRSALKDGRQAAIEDALQRIERSVGTMARMIDDLLELARVGRGIDPGGLADVKQVVREAVRLLEARIKLSGAVVEIEDDLPVLRADPVRLQQAFQNLIDNACKFAEPGQPPQIRIGCRHSGAEVILTVTDNGVGLSADQEDQVFELFSQVDDEAEGTGLGLAIVARVARLHEGRAWVESEGRGHGSCFCLALPAHRLIAQTRIIPQT